MDNDEGKIQLGKTKDESNRDLKARILAAKQQILENLDHNDFRGEATQKWISNMNSSLTRAEETMRVSIKTHASELSMIELFDKLFDLFDRYAYEFNHAPPVPGMTVTLVRPMGYTERHDYKTDRKIKCMHGHLTGQHFAMIFFGEDNCVDAYLVPSETLLGFQPGQYRIFMRIEGTKGQEKTVWKVLNQPIDGAELPELARRLVGHLVSVVIGHSDIDVEFKWSATEQERKALPEPIVVNRNYEGDDEGSMLLKEEY